LQRPERLLFHALPTTLEEGVQGRVMYFILVLTTLTTLLNYRLNITLLNTYMFMVNAYRKAYSPAMINCAFGLSHRGFRIYSYKSLIANSINLLKTNQIKSNQITNRKSWCLVDIATEYDYIQRMVI